MLSNSLHAVLPVSLLQKSETHYMVNLQKLFLPGSPKTGISRDISFKCAPLPGPQSSISLPTGTIPFALFSPVLPLAPSPLASILPEPTLPFVPSLWHQHSEPSLRTPSPVQHSRTSSGKKRMWNSNHETAGRPDSLPNLTDQTFLLFWSFYESSAMPVSWRERGREVTADQDSSDYHLLPIELIICNFTESWTLTIKTACGLGGWSLSDTCLLLAYFQDVGTHHLTQVAVFTLTLLWLSKCSIWTRDMLLTIALPTVPLLPRDQR